MSIFLLIKWTRYKQSNWIEINRRFGPNQTNRTDLQMSVRVSNTASSYVIEKEGGGEGALLSREGGGGGGAEEYCPPPSSLFPSPLVEDNNRIVSFINYMIIICDYIYDFLFPHSPVIFWVLRRRFINRFREGKGGGSEIILIPLPPTSEHSYYCKLAPVSWFSFSKLFPIELIRNRDESRLIFSSSSSSFLPSFFLSFFLSRFRVTNFWNLPLWRGKCIDLFIQISHWFYNEVSVAFESNSTVTLSRQCNGFLKKSIWPQLNHLDKSSNQKNRDNFAVDVADILSALMW